MTQLWLVLVLFATIFVTAARAESHGEDVPCTALYAALICCPAPAIDALTRQPVSCTRNHTARVPCFARPGVACDGKTHVPTANASAGDDGVDCGGVLYALSDSVFDKEIPCAFIDPDNVYEFETALGLSVFFGMFGLDRFYLGYPGIGLLKMFTLGFFFVGQLVDIVMIALQIVGPADGTSYRMPYNGPRVSRLRANDETVSDSQ